MEHSKIDLLFVFLAATVLLAALNSWSCAGSQGGRPAAKSLSPQAWADQTLQQLTLREKVGQMFFTAVTADHLPKDSPERQRIEQEVAELGVGGVHIWRGEPYALVELSNRLQSLAKVPLIFEADFEHGTGWRFPGGVDFPPAMAIAATGDTTLAYEMGRITGIEARAMGIHLTFSPVVDVNSNPYNPIINTRSFGEAPDEVARFANAFIRGAHDGGILTTAKHFPGHGDTQMDSHLVLTTIDADSARLFAVELAPFAAAIAAGTDAIMTAHIYLRRWPMRPYTPATLSPAILTGLLRQRLGFDGLIFTDAMEMHSVSHNFTERYAAVAAVQAGADVILVTPDIRAGIDAVVQAVQRGDLTEARIDASVRRLLLAKAKLGLHRQRTVAASDLPKNLGQSEAQKTAHLAAQKALTLLRNDGGVLPLSPARRDSQVAVVMVSDRAFADIGEPLLQRLRRALPHLSVSRLSDESSDVALQDMAARVDEAALVIMPVFTFVQAYKGGIRLSENAVAAVRQVLQSGKPVMVISMGNPFILQQLPEAKVYLCAFGEKAQMQEAVANALLGRAPIGGHIPVHLPGFFEKGDGIDLTPAQALADIPAPKPAPRLRQGFPEEAGFSRMGMSRVDSMMQAAVQDSAFPGAVLLVARNAVMAHFQAYGNLGYGEYARPVPLNAIYDLASLTKVVATTTAAMLLVQEGKLDLDARVQSYLPEFIGAGKDSVTVRHLLVHASGLPPFKRYFLEELTPGEIVQHILQEPLEYSPGTDTRYSDLGMILLAKIIEKLAGTTLDQFCRERIFAPLGMNETFFNPPQSLFDRIPPTEDDPWRQRVVHGVVHDENAFALGGVAGHAGLFSSAHDLAIFAQMLLNGGAYDHTRLLQPEIIAQFTRRQNLVPGSERALGWDTRSAEGSSSGQFMSMRAFGHTGFTGTSIWIDPENRLFVVLLTNRVHPTRANRKLYPFRPQLHDAIMQALQKK